MWVNLSRMKELPILLRTIFPISLLTSLLRLKPQAQAELPMQKPMAVRMKGKEMMPHQYSK